MTVVNIYDAKAKLSALVAEAQAGGDVVIARAGRPAVRLVPVGQDAQTRRAPGALKGKIWISPDFDEPVPGFEEFYADAQS